MPRTSLASHSRSKFRASALNPGCSRLRASKIKISKSPLARSLEREDADRLIASIRELAEEDAKAVAESANNWRVVVVKQSLEDAEAVAGKLEAAGFDATVVGRDDQRQYNCRSIRLNE